MHNPEFDHPGDIDALATFCRHHSNVRVSLVKKTYKVGVLQEPIAAEARGLHHTIIAEFQDAGTEMIGAPDK